ncbi:MAG: zinc ribbon domain-containing protein [Chloroflexi bacterium]|nr:zinc ribbon domain-containing protein [Chloroflexota bacterium]
MEFIVIAILVVVVIAFIAYPLFTSPAEQAAPAVDALDSLIAQRDSAYDAIRDLDFDYQMGKLSQSDYELLRDKYKARAAQALQQIDEVAGRDGAESRIEEEVARLRERRKNAPVAAGMSPAPADDAIEQQVARLRTPRTKATNGDAVEAEVARLRASKSKSAGLRCRNCGTPYHAGDRFCAKCGNTL